MATAHAPQTTSHVFHGLDQIRGLLCLFIVIWHVNAFLRLGADDLRLELAVDVFFVLSGFVIAHAYLGRLEQGFGALNFVAVRLIRFYPLLFLGLTLGALRLAGDALIGNGDRDPGFWLGQFPQFFFLPVAPFTANTLFPFNPPAWSLFAELLINIAFVLVWPRLGVRTLLAIVLAGAASVAAVAFWFDGLSVGWGWGNIAALFARVTFGFPAGVLLYRLYQQGWRAPRLWSAILLAALAAIMFVPVPKALHPIWDTAFVLLVSPLCVWLGAVATNGPIGEGLANLSGRLSYAVYAIHYSLIGLLFGLDGKLTHITQAQPWVAAALISAAVILAAWAADAYFDAPVRRWLNRLWFERRPPRPAAPALVGGIDDSGRAE